MEYFLQYVFGQSLPFLLTTERKWRPNVDVFECGETIVVIAELAGVEREDVSLVFQDGKLYLSGVRKDAIPHKTRRYRQMEISYDQFERVIFLPDDVDAERITARLRNGLMIIEAPKRKREIRKDQRVEIEEYDG
ncbi:MAG: Hsp20/alpha crystallin family protein [Candidatus Abyssubacteria bacterium]